MVRLNEKEPRSKPKDVVRLGNHLIAAASAVVAAGPAASPSFLATGALLLRVAAELGS